jgi:signal transduction histidine kinase
MTVLAVSTGKSIDDMLSRASIHLTGPRGSEKVAIYNEGFAQAVGKAHPKLMGQGFADAFPEICKDIMPVFEAAARMKKAAPVLELPLMVNRNYFLEETFFSGNFNALRGDDGRVAGFYNSLSEVTRQRISDRRRIMLNSLSILPKGCTSETVGTHFINCLRTNTLDIPFALLWSVDNDQSSSIKDCGRLRLTGSIGLPEDHKLNVPTGSINSSEGIYPLLKETTADPITTVVESQFDGIQWEGFGEPSKHICSIPLSNAGRTYGYLMVGANPRRPIDEDHKQFMRDLATQMSSTMAFLVTTEESNRRQFSLENKLAASEHHIRYMANHLDIGLEHLDLSGRVLWANEHYFSLTGQKPSTDFGNSFPPFSYYVVEEDKPKLEQAWQAVLEGVTIHTTEVRLSRLWTPPSGAAINAAVLISVIPYKEDGEIKSIMTCMTEVSRLKWAESWQARAAQEAQEAKRQQSEFTDAISHEIRNPLSAMLQLANSISGSLEEAQKSDASAEDYLHVIQENVEAAKVIIFCAEHQKKIVDDVLVLSKMDFMLLSLSPSPVQPMDLVNNAVKMLHANIAAADIDIGVEADESISRLGLGWALCDPLRVTQILVNILSNAIKFTRLESHRNVTVRYGASVVEPRDSFKEGIVWAASKREVHDVTIDEEWGHGDQIYLTFCVTDTGPGMTEEERGRLFNRFQQASPKTSIKYGGTGLGLFISHTLAEKQSGSMGVASEPGRGSTFAFFIKGRRLPDPPTPSTESNLQNTQELVLRQLESTEALEDMAIRHEPLGTQNSTAASSPKIPHERISNSDMAYHILLVEVILLILSNFCSTNISVRIISSISESCRNSSPKLVALST